jgi:hypothetical protein
VLLAELFRRQNVEPFMKMRRTVVLAFCFVLAAAALNVAQAKSKKSRLMKQVSVSRHEAETTARTKVPDGVLKSAELEKEHGKVVWSFDFARPGTKDVTEVQVNAKNGDIVSVKNETPAKEAAEARAEKAKK